MFKIGPLWGPFLLKNVNQLILFCNRLPRSDYQHIGKDLDQGHPEMFSDFYNGAHVGLNGPA